MSSTNKTTNYQLSQFVGTDKPAWLSDYNQDMNKIDTGIHTANEAATAASSAATAAGNSVGDITALTTEAKSSAVAAINEVNTKAGQAINASSVNSGAITTLNSEVSKLTNQFAIDNVYQVNNTDLTIVTGTGNIDTTNTTLTIAKNDDATLFKFYGQVFCSITSQNNSITVRIPNTGIVPKQQYNVTMAGFTFSNSSDANYFQPVSFTVGNNYIDLVINTGYGASSTTRVRAFLFASLYFNDNFGDAIIEPEA